MIKFVLFLALSFTGFVRASDALTNVSSEEITGLIRIVNRVEKLCPPEECTYIGIGRSPTPITTLMRASEKFHVIDLPLSTFRYTSKESYLKMSSMGFKPKLSSKEKKVLYHHFDNYLQKEDIKKRILLIDFSVRGTSILSAHEYLKKYFKENNTYSPKVELFIMARPEDVNKIKYNLNKLNGPDTLIYGISRAIESYFYSQKFDKYAKEGRFFLSDYKTLGAYNSKWKKGINTNKNNVLFQNFHEKIVKNKESFELLGFKVGCDTYLGLKVD